MRKLLFTFALTLLATTGTWAQTTFTVDNLKYKVTDDTANTVKLTGYETQPTGTLDIPASVSYYDTEYSVTSIGDRAFSGCYALKQITLPESVTSIGSGAFQVCSALKQITLPESVTSIGDRAFYYCSALTQVTIGSGVTSIGNGAFYNCSALAEMTVLPTVPPTITAYTFSNINPQVKVSIPEGSKEAYMADENWKWLLDLSAGQLSGTCGDNLTWTFTTADCTLTISGTGDMYNYNPWYEFNQAIKNISIQDGVTSIGSSAFRYCSALTQVTIGSGVTSIGDAAFYECSALTQVTIGNSVESIGDRAFYGCSALTAVYYTGDVAGWCGITFTGYTSNPLSCAHNLYIGTGHTRRRNRNQGLCVLRLLRNTSEHTRRRDKHWKLGVLRLLRTCASDHRQQRGKHWIQRVPLLLRTCGNDRIGHRAAHHNSKHILQYQPASKSQHTGRQQGCLYGR